MIRMHYRELDDVRTIHPRRVEKPAVEKEHVTGLELDCHRRFDELPVHLELGAKEQMLIETASIELEGVAPWHDEQRAVIAPL